jgi:molecular chaperone DnaK
MEGGAPQVIPGQNGNRTTPSVIGFTAKGESLVGGIAKRQAITNPRNTVFGVKRLIGRKFDSSEVNHVRPLLPYQLVQSPNGDVCVQIEEKVYSIPEISSLVLQKLKAAAEDYLGEMVEDATVTVPANFDDSQRQATKDAALIAGFRTVNLINEPTAAALAYGLKNAKGQFVAVYDLGGGTFDITILEMADGLFQVKATGGDTFLGGEDFDQRIIDWLISEFQREVGIDLKQDRMALQRLKEAAEKAKCELSTSQQTEIVLPFISADASGPKHLNTVLTRQKYESLTDDLLEKTEDPCRRCLADAGMRADQIDEVLLVGGQTRAPKVAEIVRKVFGKEPNRAVNPDEGVAMGAAIQTGIITGEVKDLVLLDVTPYGILLTGQDGTLMPLVDRNSTIPTRKRRVFTTVEENQTRIVVEVHMVKDGGWQRNELDLTNVAAAASGVPQIEVTFEIDVNGIASVGATDQATGHSQSMVIHPSGGLSRSEIDRLVAATRAREEQERPYREAGWVVRDLDCLVERTVRLVGALGSKLTVGEQEGIHAALGLARKALSQGNLDAQKASLLEMKKAASMAETRAREEQERLVWEPEAVMRRLASWVEDTMRLVEALDSKLTFDEQKGIEAALGRARKALSGGDLEAQKASLLEMGKTATIIGQAIERP